jgi:hypothetical protein
VTGSVEGPGASGKHLEFVEAVGSFFRDDPARILAVAGRLRGPSRTLESTVQGTSMGRTLPPGSRIRIDLAERAAYDVGEVVAFLAGSQLIVHRVVARRRRGPGQYLLTLGDAALVPDAPVVHGHVLGTVTGVGDGTGWAAPGPRPERSPRARVLTAGLQAILAGVLVVSPRGARRLARLLHRSAELASRAISGARRRPPEPRPPVTA